MGKSSASVSPAAQRVPRLNTWTTPAPAAAQTPPSPRMVLVQPAQLQSVRGRQRRPVRLPPLSDPTHMHRHAARRGFRAQTLGYVGNQEVDDGVFDSYLPAAGAAAAPGPGRFFHEASYDIQSDEYEDDGAVDVRQHALPRYSQICNTYGQIPAPLLYELKVSQGTLWPPFSPYISFYELLVPIDAKDVLFFPRCEDQEFEPVVNFRAPFCPVPLADLPAEPGSTLRVFITLRPRDSFVSRREASLAQVPPYIVSIRRMCAHERGSCDVCHFDALPSLPLRPASIPFASLRECTHDYQACSTHELSFHAGDIIAVRLASASGQWWFGDIVCRASASEAMLSSPEGRLHLSGWFPHMYTSNVSSTVLLGDGTIAPAHRQAGSPPQEKRGQPAPKPRSGLVYLATAVIPFAEDCLDPAQCEFDFNAGDQLVITSVSPRLSSAYGVVVTVEEDGSVRPRGSHCWFPLVAVSIGHTRLVDCKLIRVPAESAMVAQQWGSSATLFPASKNLFSEMDISGPACKVHFTEGRLIELLELGNSWRLPCLAQMSETERITAVHPARQSIVSVASRSMDQRPSLSIANLQHRWKHMLVFTLAVITAQLMMLLIALGKGGVHGHDNPLLGPSFDTLKSLGARWQPDILDGMIYKVFTPLFLPVGIVRFVLDTILHLLMCSAIEAEYGSTRTAFIYFASGICSHIVGAIFVPLWLVTGCGGSLFGLVGALVWLDVKRRLFLRNNQVAPTTALLNATDAENSMVAHANPRSYVAIRSGTLSLRHAICTGILLFVILVLGGMPGCDNWTHLAGIIPGFLAAMTVEHVRHAGKRAHELAALRAAGFGMLSCLVLTTVIILVYVSDTAFPCRWCMRATCFNVNDWCSLYARLGGPSTTS